MDSSSQINSTSGTDLSDSWVTYQLDSSQLLDREKFDNEIVASPSPRQIAAFSVDLETLLSEAQMESGSSGSSSIVRCTSSPERSIQGSPPRSGLISPDDIKHSTQILDTEENTRYNEVENDTEWIWDWSSKPENRPPSKSQFRRPKSQTLSMRKTSVMKSTIFSWEFMQVFIPSIIITNILAFGLGICVGKKLVTTARNS